MNNHRGYTPPTRSARPCPICGKPAVARYGPFCSKRCADIDLGRWFGESYRIPAEEEEPESPPRDEPTNQDGD